MKPGTGIYTPADAAMLLHEKPSTIRRWAFGYIRNRRGETVEHPPLLLKTDLPEMEGQQALTFVELVELLYIRAFERAGVTWKVIKEAASVAAKMYCSDHPFALRQLYVDPRSVYGGVVERDGTESLIQLVGHGQHAIPQLVKPYLDQLDFDVNDVAVRWWPMGRLASVVVDPRYAFGAPIVDEVGIRTRTLSDAVAAESARYKDRTMEHVAWMYQVSPRQVEAAMAFKRWLMTPTAEA